MSGDVHAEATYFNQSLSLWEPLLETVEKRNGRVEQWDVRIKVKLNNGLSIFTLFWENRLISKKKFSFFFI